MCTSDDVGAAELGGALADGELGLLGAAVGDLDENVGALLDDGAVVPDDVCLLAPPHAASDSEHTATIPATTATLRVGARPMRGIPPFPLDCDHDADAQPYCVVACRRVTAGGR
jgi:hypothetical protein